MGGVGFFGDRIASHTIFKEIGGFGGHTLQNSRINVFDPNLRWLWSRIASAGIPLGDKKIANGRAMPDSADRDAGNKLKWIVLQDTQKSCFESSYLTIPDQKVLLRNCESAPLARSDSNPIWIARK